MKTRKSQEEVESKLQEEVLFTAKKVDGQILVDAVPMNINELCSIGYTAFQIAKDSLEKQGKPVKEVTLKEFIRTCMKNQL